jgi:hypothetical protein
LTKTHEAKVHGSVLHCASNRVRKSLVRIGSANNIRAEAGQFDGPKGPEETDGPVGSRYAIARYLYATKRRSLHPEQNRYIDWAVRLELSEVLAHRRLAHCRLAHSPLQSPPTFSSPIFSIT